MAKKFYIQTYEKSCMPFDSFMTKWEMRAFGWRDKGYKSEFEGYDITVNWETKTAYQTSRYSTWHVFKRVKPYSRNIIFKFLEALMTFFSWIRRKLIPLLLGLVIICLGIAGISALVGSFDYAKQVFVIALGVLAFIYLPSIVLSILGFLFRVLTGQERKLKKRLAENGYEEEQKF